MSNLAWTCMVLSLVHALVGFFGNSQDAHTRAVIFLVGAMVLYTIEQKK